MVGIQAISKKGELFTGVIPHYSLQGIIWEGHKMFWLVLDRDYGLSKDRNSVFYSEYELPMERD